MGRVIVAYAPHPLAETSAPYWYNASRDRRHLPTLTPA